MTPPPVKVGEITASALVLNLAAIPVCILVIGAVVGGVLLLPHRIPEGRLDPVWWLCGIVVSFSVHELLHALALGFFSRLPWSAFSFGFNWRLMVAYCHCRQPVTMRAFRYCALAPLATLGSLTVLATLIYPALWLALVTGIHLSGCIGDVWLVARSRRYPEHFLILDFPNRIGGEVFEPQPAAAHDPVQAGTATL
jgi:hypothetical protein